MTTTDEPFFHRDGDVLHPTAHAAGPWSGASLNGRVITGILASELERLHGDPAFLPARLTVDMQRAPGLVPLKVETSVVRDGRRIRLIDARLIADGQVAARASCQFLLRTENPAGHGWHGERWKVPGPEELPPGEPTQDNIFGLWEMRWIEGAMGVAGQRRLWMREVRDMVGGEPLSPFTRVSTAVDYASPLANVGGAKGYAFINSDITMYLHRLPAGEWIGLESLAHEASDGMAIGHCNIYDTNGRIGWGSTCGLVPNTRP